MCGYIIAKPFCVAYAVSIKQNLSRLKKEVDLGLVSVFGPWTEKSKIVRPSTAQAAAETPRGTKRVCGGTGNSQELR